MKKKLKNQKLRLMLSYLVAMKKLGLAMRKKLLRKRVSKKASHPKIQKEIKKLEIRRNTKNLTQRVRKRKSANEKRKDLYLEVSLRMKVFWQRTMMSQMMKREI